MAQSAYGTWRSPFTAAAVARSAMSLDIARSGVSLGYIQVDEGRPYWIESDRRGSRIVTPDTAGVRELTAESYGIRTRVNETPTGRPYAVKRNTLFFSNGSDQRVYI